MKLHFANGGDHRRQGIYRGPCSASAVAWSELLVDDQLHLATSLLEDGCVLEWPDHHGEEALYVESGALEVERGTVPSGGAALLEAGARPVMRAVGTTRVAHFWSQPRHERSDVAGGDAAHLLGPRGWYCSGGGNSAGAVWFADSTCEGCELALLKVSRDEAGHRGRAHSHSVDEIIYVVGGAVRFGAHEVPVGSAVFIPANLRYAVTAGPSGYAFVNFRAARAQQVYERGTPALEETALARGGAFVGDFVDVV